MKQFSYPLQTDLAPADIFAYWHEQEGALFLDSSDGEGYSVICLPPKDIFTYKYSVDKIDPFQALQVFWEKYKTLNVIKTPCFTSGIAGYISYDIRHALEVFETTSKDELNLPDIWMGAYTDTLVYDHARQELTFYTLKNNEEDAFKALNTIEKIVSKQKVYKYKGTGTPLNWLSNFNKETYMRMLKKVIAYIRDGDIFQACLAQRYQADLPQDFDPYSIYMNLRRNSPAPFSGYLNMGEAQLFTNSPERFLKCEQGQVETKPIKGTRPRGKSPDEDKRLAEALLNSSKERAENAMIVDILRNDLHKACAPETVKVPALFERESYANVHHLVSTVIGQLREGKTAIELLKACLPGGSITGAPKIRAMEIIDMLEGVQRGPYCGMLGAISSNGDMDSNILIRSCLIKNGRATIYSGGGIVADSDPEQEYEETCVKAKNLFEAFRGSD